jgi:hypothetical protein
VVFHSQYLREFVNDAGEHTQVSFQSPEAIVKRSIGPFGRMSCDHGNIAAAGEDS